MSLELKYVKLETLTQSGSVLYSEESSSDFPLSSDHNAISERKRLTFSFDNLADEYDPQSIEGALLYVNFAMFMPVGFIYSEPNGPPACGFNLRIPASLHASETHPMYFYCSGNTTVKTNNNYKCFFLSSSEDLQLNNEFSIVLEYYNTFDEGTYFNYADKNNQWRFMSEYFNQLNFNEIPDSVYHMTKDLRAIVMLQSEVITKREFALLQLQANTFNAPSSWAFGSTGFTEISSSQDTEVYVWIKTASENEAYYLKIFNDKNDSAVDFVSNYNIQENRIEPGSTNNVFKAPFGNLDVVIDGEYYRQLHFTIDKDFINQDNDYRIIGIGYDEAGVADPVVFISPQIKVQRAFPYDGNGIDFTGSISDIQREFFGDKLTASIDERLKTKMYLDYPYDKYKNDIFNRLGLEVSNDIRNFLDTVTVEIYQEYFDSELDGTVKILLETSMLRKIAPSSYTGPGITANFYDNGSQFEYTFRNRSDASAVPVSETLNGYPYYSETPIGNQYWGGKDLFIKWSFSFPYSDFTDVIEHVQKISVKDYVSDVQVKRTFSGVDYTFPGDNLCYRAELTDHIPGYNTESFLLINTIKSESLSTLEEESFAGAEMPEQSNDYIYNQDVLFSESKANYCVKTDSLAVGQEYTTSVIAKKNYSYTY